MQIMNLVFVLYGLLVYPLFMALALRNIGILSIAKKEILLYYAIFTASSCGAYFLSVKYLLAFAMPLVLFILNHKHNHLTKSVSTILVAFMLYIASDVVAFLVFIIFKINIHASSFIIKTMSLVISSIIIFALSKVVGIIMRKFNSDIWEDENIADGFGNLGIIVFAIYIISMIGKYMEAIKVTKNAIMYGSVIILSFLIVISILRLKFENAVRKLELKHQKEYQSANSNYLKEIEEHYNSLRIFKHDYLNILASMRGYIDSEDLAGLKSYFYDEILAYSKNIVYDDKILADLQYLKISEVKSLLVYKAYIAHTKNIDISMELHDEINHVSVSTAILCQILGILLDNAIEASEHTKGATIKITVIKNDNSVIFIIDNTFEDNIKSFGKLFELGYTTKEGHSGIGLATIRSFTDQMPNLCMGTGASDGYFIQNLTIYDKRK